MTPTIHQRLFAVCLPALILAGSILTGVAAHAQVFAPGKLSRSHAKWDSLGHCDECHTTGQRVDRKKCLSCHAPVAERIRQKKGFHGQKRVRTQPCENCHPEHRGETASIINWSFSDIGGDARAKRSETDFNHDQTGWPLRGSHAKVKCNDCHRKELIGDASVLKYLQSHPGAHTFQGLTTRCADCHFDEHRGQLKTRCEKCHDETEFKKAPKFNHNEHWKLNGAHKNVECKLCHREQVDANYRQNAFPRPRGSIYLQMTPVAHGKCVDCHEDPHEKRFGDDCLSCHTEDTWILNTPPRDLTFHDRTNFPLKGRHRFVPCERCHPRNAFGKMERKPIAHDRCNTCHPNAHPDLGNDARLSTGDCRDCHDNNGYSPSTYSIESHQKSRFPLSVPHQAVPCTDCHLNKMGSPIGENAARKLDGFAANRVRSPWRMTARISPDDCSSCHESPHRGQFGKKKCTACHVKTTWKIDPASWQHSRHSKYALEGRHKKVPCTQCHKTETDLDGQFVRYRPMAHDDCIDCHADQHAGQFQYLSPRKKCRDCHDVNGFAPSRFDHNNPAFSSFPLKGKHASVKCARCHPRVKLADGFSTLRYRPTVTDCDLCHEDEHKGAFQKAAAMQRGSDTPFHNTSDATAQKDLWQMPSSWIPEESSRTDCAACHDESGFANVRFNHDNTRFPLKGRHRQVACASCHKTSIDDPLPLTCEGCHTDVHRGSLGRNCQECHDESGFQNTLPAVLARHNRSRFPLIGRHAAVPCTECHRDANGREFKKMPTDCRACHAKDIPGPGESAIDHGQLDMACDRCHTPVGWQTAAFEGHDRCFPIGTFAKHGSVACSKCHQGNPPRRLANCDTGTFSCIQCHGCQTSRHRGVRGYSCEDRRCYECHRTP